MEYADVSDGFTTRAESAKDAAAVRTINVRAFDRRDEADLVEALRSSCPDRVSLVAELNAQLVGHILFTPVTLVSPGRRLDGMGLAPVAVLPEFQRRGIGSRLIDAGLETLRRNAQPFVVVLGDPAYYSRFGFHPASRYGVTCEFEGVPEEAFMVVSFHEQLLKGTSGVARYRPEFQALA